MKKTLFIILLFPLLGFSQQTINGTIMHDNILRSYILYVPDSYFPNVSAPLVFNFHGYTSDASSQMWYGDFREIADTAGFLIVHPMGTLDAGGITHFNVGWGGSTVDDVAFSEALLDTLVNQYNIDLNRVYSTGMSNGGFMSYYLACQLSDRIAAIASVTGSMTSAQYAGCNPEHPTPIMQIHGTTDQVVPYNGGSFSVSIDVVMEYWTTYNNCDNNAIITALPDIVTTDLSTVDHILYNQCDNNVTTELFKVANGGHTWPGSIFTTTDTNYDINASAEIWKFFSKYDINGLITPVSILESKKNDVNNLIKVVDVFGRECNPATSNSLLFYIYDNGVVKKEIKPY